MKWKSAIHLPLTTWARSALSWCSLLVFIKTAWRCVNTLLKCWKKSNHTITPSDLIWNDEISNHTITPSDLIWNDEISNHTITPSDLIYNDEISNHTITLLDLIWNDEISNHTITPSDLMWDVEMLENKLLCNFFIKKYTYILWLKTKFLFHFWKKNDWKQNI